MKHTSTQKGRSAEEIAAQYLQKNDFSILQKNVYTPYGEIDIVAKKGSEFICVEVRSRSNTATLAPEMTLSSKKYKRLVLSILSIGWLENQPVRIDFITVLKDAVHRHYRDLRWDMVSASKKLQYSF